MSDNTTEQLITAAKTQGTLKENMRVLNILITHMNRIKEDINAMRPVETADKLLIKLFHEINNDQ